MLLRFEHWKGRAARLALVALVHALAILLGYYLSPPITPRKPEAELEVTMLPAPRDMRQEKPKSRTSKAQRKEARPKPATIVVPEPEVPLPMIMMSSDVFRASDISKIRSRSDAPALAEGADDSDPSVGVGPGGAKVYNAEWYRKPTDAEISGYMPKNLNQSGWALIMCRTIADYRVEDCRELDEWPHGSGLARAMRQAAWQFRIRPTRINGKSQIGTWVRIHYTITLTERR
ncbi:MAG: hypothetical protein EOP61_21035 [Sphingomonadales bacterium]|nr:MAG: hypothetical protein EOP61_21035 [Sphingomonadales bacterium]